MSLTNEDKQALVHLVTAELEEFRKTGHVANDLIANLAGEEKYEHFLEELIRKLGGKVKEGHQ